MAEYSFDITCSLDKQEIQNALHLLDKELKNRFDFRDVVFEVALEKSAKNSIDIVADSKMKLEHLLDTLKEKLVKRSLNLRAFQFGTPQGNVSGKHRCLVTIQNGLTQEQCKNVNQCIRQTKLKVKSRIQGETIRVSSSSKNDLQAIINELKQQEFDFAIMFENYR